MTGSGNGGAPRSRPLSGIRDSPKTSEGKSLRCPTSSPHCPGGWVGEGSPAASGSLTWPPAPGQAARRLPSPLGSCPPCQVLGYGIQMLEEDGEFT